MAADPAGRPRAGALLHGRHRGLDLGTALPRRHRSTPGAVRRPLDARLPGWRAARCGWPATGWYAAHGPVRVLRVGALIGLLRARRSWCSRRPGSGRPRLHDPRHRGGRRGAAELLGRRPDRRRGERTPALRRARVDAVIARFNQFNYVGALLGAVMIGVVGAGSLRVGFAVPMVLVLGILPLARGVRPALSGYSRHSRPGPGQFLSGSGHRAAGLLAAALLEIAVLGHHHLAAEDAHHRAVLVVADRLDVHHASVVLATSTPTCRARWSRRRACRRGRSARRGAATRPRGWRSPCRRCRAPTCRAGASRRSCRRRRSCRTGSSSRRSGVEVERVVVHGEQAEQVVVVLGDRLARPVLVRRPDLELLVAAAELHDAS